ncbi:MAG: glycosyltransferase [Planctomycetes bacterium]|nr:glycosyltransferase [Planctomycetota bacterium]MCB9918374.1 glycosyltransferase [Planctomycetota bacterium]
MSFAAEDPAARLTEEEIARGIAVAKRLRVAVFVVAYDAESHIESTLRRIPSELMRELACVYVIDDQSHDATFQKAQDVAREFPQMRVFRTPQNQGYGGNQKLGYEYAIREGFDVVVLLHGDGQYAPEAMPRLLAAFEDDATSAVFGSRMMVPGAAKRGGMPFYKRVGNRVLTWLENKLLGSELTEFHSGYRAYRVQSLAELPFRYNTNDFHFDTEIIVQLLGKNMKIVEVPIPTYYGDEICHVNGIAYAAHCIGTIARYKANRVYLVHHPKFDLEGDGHYVFKEAPNSLHQAVLDRGVPKDARVVELGSGHGEVGRSLHDKGAKVVAVDLIKPDVTFPFPYLARDLDEPFADTINENHGARAQLVVALDVIEHLKAPEASLREIRGLLEPGGRLLASTGNVAYLPLRFLLFCGMFNYGKKGILDLTHKRLFTTRSFKRTLEGEGFVIDKLVGFGPPIRDMIGKGWFFGTLDSVCGFFARLWPSVFAYQFLVEARARDGLEDILARTVASGQARVASEPEPHRA